MYLEDTLIRKKLWFGAVGKCSNVAYEVSCRYKKIAIELLAASARTANKINLKPISIGGTLPVFLSCQKAQPR